MEHLSVLRVERSADNLPAYFAGTGADLVEFGVTQVAAGRVVVDVAIAAENLDGIQRHLSSFLGRIQDDSGAILVAGVADVASPGHVVQIGAARVHCRVHVGHFTLHELEFADPLIELLAGVGVVECCVAARLHYTRKKK